MNILIAGGAGYIGGYLTDYLSTNNNILVYDNLLYESMFLKKVPFHFGDVRDTDNLSKVIEKFQPDAIIWLSAIVGDGACQAQPDLTNSVNYESVKWLCDNYSGKIIFTSTCSVYGVNNDVIDESAKPDPLSIYASTKLKAEQYLLTRHDNCLIFRLGTLYGLSDTYSRIRLDLVANILTLKAVTGEPLSVFGGEQWRPLLHVRDVSTAIKHGIDNGITGLFNLCEKNYTIKELAEKIVETVASESIINYTDMSFEDLRNYKVSSSKFRDAGWQPQHDLKRGLFDLAEILKQKRVKNTADPLFSNEKFLKGKSFE
jgi:nucleoside-diphosphate-sugar epimerase|tara:strand:- start:31 stop:975 length:945 start_codon:yes stop_codon:yes gene_type:complete